MVILQNLCMGLCCVWCFLWGRKCSNTAWLSHSCSRFLQLWIENCKDFYVSINTKMLLTHAKFLNKLGQACLADIEIDCARHSLDHTYECSESLNWNHVFTSLGDLSSFFVLFSKLCWRISPKFQLVGTAFSSTENYLKWKQLLKSNLNFNRYLNIHFLGKNRTYNPGVGDRGGLRIFYVLILWQILQTYQVLQEPAFDCFPLTCFSHSGCILENCDLNTGQGVIILVCQFCLQHKLSLHF